LIIGDQTPVRLPGKKNLTDGDHRERIDQRSDHPEN
jgi:hypothetical protein